MKFNYWIFACIYFGLLIISGFIEAIANGSFSDNAIATARDATVLLGIMSYIDYKMED